MAFQARALARFATSDRRRNKASNFYTYSTPDAVSDLVTAGYFDAARRRFGLSPGDRIECSTEMLGTPRSATLLVANVALTGVTVVDLTLGGGGGPLTIAGTPPAGNVGVAYSWAPTVSGGTPPYSFEWLEVALPSGLRGNFDTGAAQGLPSAIETVSGLALRVTDSAGRTATLPDLTIAIRAPSSGFDYVNTAMVLGRAAGSQVKLAAGRGFKANASGATDIAASWDHSGRLVAGRNYRFSGKLRIVSVADGSLVTAGYRVLVRAGNDAKLTGVSPSTATTLLDTTVTDELPFTADISYTGAQPYIGVVAIGLPGSMRVELVDWVSFEAPARFLPWTIVPKKADRTLALNDVPLAVNEIRPDPVYIPPGATRVWLKLTYLAGPILMNAYVKAGTSTTGLVGFTLADISVPRYAQHWRTEDSQDLWIPVDIVNPKTAVGSRFKVSFNGEGIAGALGTFVEIKEGAVNEPPAEMPAHRAPLFLDLASARPQITLDIPNVKWSDTGWVDNIKGGVRCLRNHPSHGVSNWSSNKENGLYVGHDTFPDVWDKAQSIEVDSNGQSFIQLKAKRFDVPKIYSGKAFPFQASMLQFQMMTEWCHRRGLYTADFVMPAELGCWAAWWWVGRKPSGASMWCPEIDGVELFNGAFGAEYDETSNSATQHLGEFGANKRAVAHGLSMHLSDFGFHPTTNLFTQRHRWACLIEDTWITHFVDEIEILRYRNMTDDPDGSTDWTFYPIFNIAVKAPTDFAMDTKSTVMKLYDMRYYAPASGHVLRPLTDALPYASRASLPAPDEVVIPVNLSGTVKMGAKVTGNLTTGVEYEDAFTREDQNLEASSNWERLGGLAGQARIVGGKLVTSGTAAANQTVYAVAASLGIPADHFIELDWLSTVIQGGMLGVRIVDNLNGIFVQRINGGCGMYKCVNGTFSGTPIASSTTSLSPGDRVRFEAQGQTLRLIRNGSVLMSAALASGDFTTGRPGILPRTAASNPYGDNLIAGGF